jgi:hypothetical protein
MCEGQAEYESCTRDNECSPGLYCGGGQQCLKVKGDSQACQRDEECKNTMGCSLGKCTEYGSVENYEESDKDLVCKSGFSRKIDDASRSICVPSPQIVDKIGPDYQCESLTDTCKYQVSGSQPFTFELPCACGLSPSGASYCPNVYTDTYTTLLRRVTEL